MAAAQDAKVEDVVGGLSNPCGVAVQPGTGQVFVSDSATGRVGRVVDGKLQDVITGSPKDVYGKGPFYDIGPLGLAFTTDGKSLIVGDGGYQGRRGIHPRLYRARSRQAGARTIEKDATRSSARSPPADGIVGEGNLYAIAVTPTALYVTCNGDDTKGWVAKADHRRHEVRQAGALARPPRSRSRSMPPSESRSAQRATSSSASAAKTTSPTTACLTFYSAKTGRRLLQNDETGLYDITGLAYSPKTGLLYATDFAWMAPDEGGLFRLDAAAHGGAEGTKIASLDKPTALAFAPDGTLYITVVGPKSAERKRPQARQAAEDRSGPLSGIGGCLGHVEA